MQPQDLNSIVTQITSIFKSAKLTEEQICLILANITLNISVENLKPLDMIVYEGIIEKDETFEDFNEVYRLLHMNIDLNSALLAEISHRLIALSYKIQLQKEQLYGTKD